jgi:hypothetical protein
MIEFIVEVVLSVLWEGFLQLVGEALIVLGWRTAGEPFRERGRAHPVVAGMGLLLMGGVIGFLLSLAFPTRLVTGTPVPGISLVLSPILAGLVMDRYGHWRESRGVEPSYSATFWGGAIFAFGMALARFLLVNEAS